MTVRWLSRLLITAALLWQPFVRAADTPSPGEATCFGTFFNPITDVCWQCIFPISIGAIAFDNGQEDIENPASPICICPIAVPPYYRIGLEVGFWEPARTMEITRTAFCFPSLGGFYMDGGRYAPPGGQDHIAPDKVNKGSFYQAHYYINPILYYLEVLIDDQCLEPGAYDLAYMTEYDPAWHDDELTAILEPEAPLFANIVAIAACTADCIAASAGFGIKEMFWCSGCNGPTYPMNGNVPVHIGGVQASSLIAHRMMAKLHRQFIAQQAERIYTAIDSWRKSHPKPVIAVINNLGASAAYMVALHCDEIYAGKYSLVGSIGAVLSGWDFHKALERVDVGQRVYASGNLKAMLNPYLPMSPEADNKAKDLVAKMGQQFRLELETERKGKLASGVDFGSGEIWGGIEAQKLGLIDGVSTLDQVVKSRWPDLKIHGFGPGNANGLPLIGTSVGQMLRELGLSSPDALQAAVLR